MKRLSLAFAYCLSGIIYASEPSFISTTPLGEVDATIAVALPISRPPLNVETDISKEVQDMVDEYVNTLFPDKRNFLMKWWYGKQRTPAEVLEDGMGFEFSTHQSISKTNAVRRIATYFPQLEEVDTNTGFLHLLSPKGFNEHSRAHFFKKGPYSAIIYNADGTTKYMERR